MKIRLKRHHECVRDVAGFDPKQNHYWRRDLSSTIGHTIVTFTYDARYWESALPPSAENRFEEFCRQFCGDPQSEPVEERKTMMKIRMKQDHSEVRAVVPFNHEHYRWRNPTNSSFDTATVYSEDLWEPVPEPNEERKTTIKIRKKNNHTCIKEVEKTIFRTRPWRNVSSCDGTETYYSREIWEPVPIESWRAASVDVHANALVIRRLLQSTSPVTLILPEGLRFRYDDNGKFDVQEEVTIP